MGKVFFFYGAAAISIFVILGIALYPEYKGNELIYLANFTYLISFIALFAFYLSKENPGYKLLILLCTCFIFLFGTLYVILIYDHSGFLFQFVPSDAPFYDAGGRYVTKGNIFIEIRNLISETKYEFDDMGMIFYVGMLYHIVDSPIIVKLANLVVNAVSIYLIYQISLSIMPKRFAALAALTFSASSFNIWFLVSGLKEPLMVLIVLLYFHQYLRFSETRKLVYLIRAGIVMLGILFFRVPIVLFMIAAVAGGEFLNSGLDIKKVVAALSVFLGLLMFIFIFSETIIWYSNRTNPAYRQDAEKAKKINPAIVTASGVFGPFPTVTPKVKKRYEDVSVYAPSLIFKMFLSLYFVFAIYFIFKEKKYFFIPMLAFCWVELLGLSLIEQTFKLRYAIPHMPFVIIGAFYSLYYLYEKYPDKNHGIKQFIWVSNIGLISIILFWNILR